MPTDQNELREALYVEARRRGNLFVDFLDKALAAPHAAGAEDYKAKYEDLVERYARNKAACCRARGRLMQDAVASVAQGNAEPSEAEVEAAARVFAHPTELDAWLPEVRAALIAARAVKEDK